MRCEIMKLTNESLMRTACQFTSGKESKITLEKIYECEHSPIRTQLFWIELYDIPSFVSVHFARHNIGVTHFVKTNRDDITGQLDSDINRLTPVNHAMLINAQALINMARKRLCHKAHEKTWDVMTEIRNKMLDVDVDLYMKLVPDCVYRGKCHELKPCGVYDESL